VASAACLNRVAGLRQRIGRIVGEIRRHQRGRVQQFGPDRSFGQYQGGAFIERRAVLRQPQRQVLLNLRRQVAFEPSVARVERQRNAAVEQLRERLRPSGLAFTLDPRQRDSFI
jgi:hypothetical protein